MKKILFLSYGIVSYAAFLITTIYTIGFVGNLFVPKTIDSEPGTSLTAAIFINASLLLLFVMQHSIMARPAFKRNWIRIIPKELERSSFVLLSSLFLALLMWLWQPVGGTVWSVQNKAAIDLLHILYLAGWGIVLISTFLINHFDLFGLRQVWLYFKGKQYTELSFELPGVYQLARHPMYAGFIIASWSTPAMTVAHLLFAVLTTGYIIAVMFVDKKVITAALGEKYKLYIKWVPIVIPFSKKKSQ